MKPTAIFLGLGSIGQRHFSNLYKHHFQEFSSFVLYDVYPENAFNAMEGHDKTRVELRRDELASIKNTVVFICTPSSEHLNDCHFLLENARLIFIEKPVTLTFRSAEELLIASRETSIVVGANMRYHRSILKVKELIETESLGEIVSARAFFGHNLANWRPSRNYHDTYSANSDEGGGVILDCIHELDYLIWLLGPVASCNGIIGKKNILGINAEENFYGMLNHISGAVSNISLDYIQNVKRRGLEVVGTDGVFIWESVGKNPETIHERVLLNYETPIDTFSTQGYDFNNTYLDQAIDIIALLRGKDINETSLLSLNDAVSEMKWVDQFKLDNG